MLGLVSAHSHARVGLPRSRDQRDRVVEQVREELSEPCDVAPINAQIRKRGEKTYQLLGYMGAGEEDLRSMTLHGTKKQAERKLREVLARYDWGYAAGDIQGTSKIRPSIA